MRNKKNWKESKFARRRGKLIASRNTGEVAVGSRLIVDIVASFYDEYIPKHVKGRLVDLGCGKVPLFEAYKDYATDIVCVDWENTLHKNEYVDYECDLSEGLPFNDEEFDSIILSDVLEHIPRPEKLWLEMSRILAPNGKILMNVPFCYWLHETPHDYYRYSEYALRRFAELSGLEVLCLKPIGGTPEILADMLAKHLQTVPVIGKPLAATVQYATALFAKTILGRKWSEKTGRVFPLGYFIVVGKLKSDYIREGNMRASEAFRPR